jgi:outer membrane protein
MMVGKKIALLSIICFCIGSFLYGATYARAAEVKIGVVDGQKVLWTCNAGAKIKAKLDAKIKGFQKEFQAEQQDLVNLKDDIQKKSSVWTSDKKEEKVLEFNKKRRDLQAKQEDARAELAHLKQAELKPIIEQIREELGKYGKAHGYTVILDVTSGAVPYNADSIDVTADVIKTLNKTMKK